MSVQSLSQTTARVVTEVAAPQYVATVMLLTSFLRHPGTPFWQSLVAAVFTTGIPMAALEWMRRAGRVTSRHVPVRQHRLPVFLVALASLLAGLVVLVASGVSSGLLAEVLAVLAGLIVCMVVTLWWKVSIHAAVATCCGLILLPVHAAIALVALVGWSRIKVRGHTDTQVLGGTLIGLAVHLGLIAAS